MSDEKAIFDQACAIAEPRVMEALEKSKAAFVDQFGGWVDAVHKDELADHFKKAGECKLKALMEDDQEKARQYAKAAERHMDSIETLGLGGVIVTKAKSASALKATAEIILDTLGDVALAIIKAIASGLVTGLIKGVMPEGGIAGEAGNFPG